MPNYIIAYHGAKSYGNPEDDKRGREKFRAWIIGLGDAIVNPGTPLINSHTISSKGISESDESNRLIGYSIIKANNMDDALKIAKRCPFLEIGTLEVAEVREM